MSPIRSAILSVWPSVVPYKMRIFDIFLLSHEVQNSKAYIFCLEFGHNIYFRSRHSYIPDSWLGWYRDYFPIWIDHATASHRPRECHSTTETYIFRVLSGTNSHKFGVFTMAQNNESQDSQRSLTLDIIRESGKGADWLNRFCRDPKTGVSSCSMFHIYDRKSFTTAPLHQSQN